MTPAVAAPDTASASDVDEPASFDAFVRARGPVLWRSAYLLTGDRFKAEDLVQTALAKTFGHYDRIVAQGRPYEAYVRRTMLNTYVSWWRRKWNAEVVSDDVGGGAAHGDEAGGVALRRDLQRALARLPRAQRAVVVLRYFEDRSEADTAALLGISVGTVKSHASRALAALRASDVLAPPNGVG